MPHPELTLERRIDAELCGLDAKMCVYADDLHGHVVERGADDEFESASTIKIYILGCLYAQAEAGKASLDAELTYEARHFVDGSGLIRSLGEGARLRARDVATLMIVVSDNIATNMLIDYLGLDTINAFIRSIGCTHTKLHRSLRSDNWSEKLGKTSLNARQVSYRGGDLRCELKGDRVLIAGQATLYLKGRIFLR